MRHRYSVFFLILAVVTLSIPVLAQRAMEDLGRGGVALRQPGGKVYVGWRMLGTDPEDVAFNLYRVTGHSLIVKLTDRPTTESTNFVDTTADLTQRNDYYVRPVVNGKELAPSAPFTLRADSPERNYIAIPLRGDYPIDRAGVGDLDGDGEYDYVVKQPGQVSDPGKYRASVDTWKIEAYKRDGTALWRRDLGWNIEQGVWWSPFVVYDLDGDGRAEVVAKTAPTDKDYRGVPRHGSKVEAGPEWFSVFDGMTGRELDRADWIPRGRPGVWGDRKSNRSSRNLMCVAYLDGRLPSLVIFRGTYALMKAEAWNFRGGKLKRLWKWSNEGLGPAYRGQGFHDVRIADVDGDGRDEIFDGAILLDDDGSTLYTTGEGHGDRFHLTDIDPDRPGLEVFYCHEENKRGVGFELTDALTGRRLWGPPLPEFADVGRCLVGDIDPRDRGLECWTQGAKQNYILSCKGEILHAFAPSRPRPSTRSRVPALSPFPPFSPSSVPMSPASRPSTAPLESLCAYFGVWWDEDLLREVTENGRVRKWSWTEHKTNNIAMLVREKYSEKLVADVVGDWREEVLSVADGELRIYTSAVPTTHRFYTFMHDPIYRLDVACMSMGYPQSANPSFYFGEGMAKPPRPSIAVTPWKPRP